MSSAGSRFGRDRPFCHCGGLGGPGRTEAWKCCFKCLKARLSLPATSPKRCCLSGGWPLLWGLLADTSLLVMEAQKIVTFPAGPYLGAQKPYHSDSPTVSERRHCYFLKTAQVRSKGQLWIVFGWERIELAFLSNGL